MGGQGKYRLLRDEGGGEFRKMKEGGSVTIWMSGKATRKDTINYFP